MIAVGMFDREIVTNHHGDLDGGGSRRGGGQQVFVLCDGNIDRLIDVFSKVVVLYQVSFRQGFIVFNDLINDVACQDTCSIRVSREVNDVIRIMSKLF